MTKTKKHANRSLSQQGPTTSMPIAIEAPLSPQWAFVVQFRATPGGPVYGAGRVEHLASGRTSHFQSLEELRVYLSRELRVAESVVKQ